MPIGLGIGLSHAPGMYLSTEQEWDVLWHKLTTARGVPQPTSVSDETGDRLKEKIHRIRAAHVEVKRLYEAYAPDVLIIIGGDQTEMFDRSNVPQFMIFLGESGTGRRPDTSLPPVDIAVDVAFSKWLLDRLVKQEGFDIAFSYEMKNLGKHHGFPHAYGYPTSFLFEDVQTPTVIIYENTFDEPSLSAKRCYDLGAAIARITRNDPRRIAILGSGGLAHDPRGRRAGWIDEPLDRWFLDQLAAGNGRATQAMYTFDSDTMVGGTGEMRAWITVAGAMEEMGSKAHVLDYIPAAKTVTGIGIASWHVDEQPAALAAE
ncbi:protocatechuate 4,5-dioxygenase beta chain [Sphingomonas vulcanisoli]|uniref:Protocatechuate 4,5-dioxygenase beta chain n=1 Tax=Sphingomonas vulcanisoli TaxID=1658060 RepID=A0ABX0TXP0_9SPHN|nr:hypothetical protein [Sphingomonas vulcanisoli]NIJ09222.1 protocatechuate 4,5-dioxygenase beta chain [Sphingomonas vulcanisoli]